MQLHQLRQMHHKMRPKRVGRGGKRGTYSGRGIKGQKSRAGRKFQPSIRQLIKRYPKLRGYKFKSRLRQGYGGQAKFIAINLDVLEKRFPTETKITPALLVEKRIIRRIKGRAPHVKILGKGKLSKKLIIEGCELSKSAKEAVERAGGAIVKS